MDICLLPELSDIDKRACYLGYTLYLPNRNYPMIPRFLSENEYSLIRGEDRNVITIELEIDREEGDEKNNSLKVMRYEIYRSIINVKRRYDYENCFDDGSEDMMYIKELTEKYYKKFIKIVHPKYIFI